MKIREIMPQDRDGWIPFMKGYQDYYEVDLSETTDNTWQRLMSPKTDGPFGLVVEDENGLLVGLRPTCFMIIRGNLNQDVISSIFLQRLIFGKKGSEAI